LEIQRLSRRTVTATGFSVPPEVRWHNPLGSSLKDDMSRKGIVLLVSRAFALLLISWAFVEVTYLPERLFALSHRLSQRSVMVAHDYWSSYYLIIAVFLVLRMLGLFLVATLFWRCGPRVEALFSPQQENQGA
jgi:hypothetical protein